MKLKRESLSKGKASLPAIKVLLTGVTIDPPGASFGPRLRDHYEFIWIMEGEATATFGKKTFKAPEGSILLRKPWVRDHYEWSPTRRTVHAYVHFNFEREPRGKPAFPSLRVLLPGDVLRPLFSYVLGLDDLDGAEKGPLMASALELLWRAYVSGKTQVKAPPLSQLPGPVEKALKVIQENALQAPPPRLGLGDLAKASHTSPASLARMFKESLQASPLEYAKLYRLERAANQLRRGTLSIKDIAVRNGFYDAFHFSRSFKQVYGFSPKAFRECDYNDWISQRNPIIRTFYSLVHKD